jgi:integrase
LPLDAATAELLRAHRARCEQFAEQLGGRLDAQAYVFARTPDGGTPFRPDTVSKQFTALVRRLAHDHTLYGLRHFMATQLGAVAGAGTVRERMGHSSLAVTSVYMHRVSEADRAAAAYMRALLDRETRSATGWAGTLAGPADPAGRARWCPAAARAGCSRATDCQFHHV